MSTQLVKFEYNGRGVRGDDERKMLNLTDMWRADGSEPNRRPVDWIRREGAAYIKFIGESQTVAGGHCLKTPGNPRKGIPPETWAIPKVALAYGMYLSAAFQDHCLGIILSVYTDGGYVVPGREQEFVTRVVAQLENVTKQLERSDESNAKLLARINAIYTPDGKVRPDQEEMIRREINTIAVEENRDGNLPKLVAYRLVDDRLRNRLRPPFTRDHGKWKTLPQERFGEVMSELARMSGEAESKARSVARHAAKQEAAKQSTIDFAAEKARRTTENS